MKNFPIYSGLDIEYYREIVKTKKIPERKPVFKQEVTLESVWEAICKLDEEQKGGGDENRKA